MAVFIGIVIWAYSKRKKADFEEAGRMALDDDKPVKLYDDKPVQNSINKAAAENGSNSKLNNEE